MLGSMTRSSRHPINQYRGAVEEVVLGRPLPQEVPWVLRIHAKGSAAVSVRDLERAFGRPPRAALCVRDRVTVVAAGRRHEAEPNRLPSSESQKPATVQRRLPSAVSKYPSRTASTNGFPARGHETWAVASTKSYASTRSTDWENDTETGARSPQVTRRKASANAKTPEEQRRSPMHRSTVP